MLQWTVISCFILSLFVPPILSRSINHQNSRKFQRNPLAKSQAVYSGNTCGQAQLPPGCCTWESHGNCGVEGSCYCDINCRDLGDCCCDVPDLFQCNEDTVVTIREGNICHTGTTTPQQTTQETNTTTQIPATTPAPTPLPSTCSAHGLNNGPNGCCEGDLCFVPDGDSVCFCDRSCHGNPSERCCGDVISNGCYPQTCSQKGINECCTRTNREECGVEISQNTTCYCDSSCVVTNDCCSDAVQLCAQTQAVEDPVKAQVANFIEAIEKDKSTLYEKMAAMYWRRYNKMNKD